MTELSLDDVLNGTEEAVEEVAAEEVATEESTEEVTTDEATETETENEEPTAEKSESTADSKESEEEKDWKFAAYQDEKRKRQELERQLEELKKPKEEAKAPDVFDDPEGFQSYQATQLDQKVMQVKAEMSQFVAEKEFGKEKVDAAFTKFSEMVKDNPELYSQAINSPSPYHQIVEIVDKAQKYEQMQNVDQFEAQMRAKIEEQIRAELEEKYSKQVAKKSNVTPSLNSQRSAEGGHNEASQSLQDIFGR